MVRVRATGSPRAQRYFAVGHGRRSHYSIRLHGGDGGDFHFGVDTSDAPTLVSWLLQAVRLGRLLGSTHSTGRRWEISSARVGHAPHPGSRPTATGTRAAGATAARSRRHRQLFNFLIDETALYRNHNISLCDCAMRISHICRAARSRSDRGHPYKLDIIALAERPSPCGVWDSELGLTRPALGADYYLTSLTSVKHREDRPENQPPIRVLRFTSLSCGGAAAGGYRNRRPRYARSGYARPGAGGGDTRPRPWRAGAAARYC